MKTHAIILRLRANADVFDTLCRGVGQDQARWKPSPSEWSILEVVNHLADEEVEDFRQRVDLTLHRPGEPWPAIDPRSWPVERRYNSRDLGESIERFLTRRDRSARWLESLEHPDWSSSSEYPPHGEITAGALLSSWLAHDYLHIRQIDRLHYQYMHDRLTPYSSIYAGEW